VKNMYSYGIRGGRANGNSELTVVSFIKGTNL
jgi:hypothetical protein